MSGRELLERMFLDILGGKHKEEAVEWVRRLSDEEIISHITTLAVAGRAALAFPPFVEHIKQDRTTEQENS